MNMNSRFLSIVNNVPWFSRFRHSATRLPRFHAIVRATFIDIRRANCTVGSVIDAGQQINFLLVTHERSPALLRWRRTHDIDGILRSHIAERRIFMPCAIIYAVVQRHVARLFVPMNTPSTWECRH